MNLLATAVPFSWAGPWIAQLTEDGIDRHVIMFGIPSGAIFDPLGLPEDAPGRVQAGYVLAALEPPRPDPTPAPLARGRVEAIFVAPQAGAPVRPLDAVRAIAGRGLEGDRYALGRGAFSVSGGRATNSRSSPAKCSTRSRCPTVSHSGSQAGRNLVTRGVDLNALVGRRFRIGELEPIGRRRCEPCAHPTAPDPARRPARARRPRRPTRRPAEHRHAPDRRHHHPDRGP